MKIFFILLLLSVVLVSPTHTQAIYDPLSVPNNIFGIHIVDENDLFDATKLVNSNGGTWGYVKLVIREDDRDLVKWQHTFDKMRKLKLIPIVRIATKIDGDKWTKPKLEDIDSWVDFLSSLNWVIENRYVIIYNEPNHAKEWGGEINPEGYATILKIFSEKLKNQSPDFFILPAGLDASASNTDETLDEVNFIERMWTWIPDIFSKIDGWSSHSYPNPQFSGSPNGYGRGTVRTFIWEQNQFAKYGINKLPVYIMETGWQHNEGSLPNGYNLKPDTVAEYYPQAFQNAWNHPQIVAITPFILNYQSQPFDQFSLRKLNSEDFYPAFEKIRSLTKIDARPRQHLQVNITEKIVPKKMVINSDYTYSLDIENLGQAIIDRNDWKLEIMGLPEGFEIQSESLSEITPNFTGNVTLALKTALNLGKYPYSIVLKRGEVEVFKKEYEMDLILPPSLFIQAHTWFRKFAQGNDFTFLLYDENEKLLHKATNVEFEKGYATISDLYNVEPNQTYRFVLIKPYYLPRQVHTKLLETKTKITFPVLLPFDPSNDGALNFRDFGAFFRRPLQSARLFIPL